MRRQGARSCFFEKIERESAFLSEFLGKALGFNVEPSEFWRKFTRTRDKCEVFECRMDFFALITNNLDLLAGLR